MKRYCLALCCIALFNVTNGQTVLYNLGTTTVETSTLFTSAQLPWELKYGPGDSLWMTTRTGQVYRVHNTNGGSTLLLDHSANVWQMNEAGMLGFAFHPQFATNPYVYIAYAYTSGGLNRERLSRFTYSGNTLGSEQVILDGGNILASNIHNGSRVAVLPDNTLLMTTGDAELPNQAQNPATFNGKVLRMNLNGSIPADNPDPSTYVYTRGHRNPQGLLVHPNGKIYSTEHGPSENDEFQIIEAGRNYGWPDVQGFCDDDIGAGESAYCTANNIKEPLLSWNVFPGPTWAPNDMIWYTHPSIPEFQNAMLITFLKTSKINVVRLNAAGDAVTSQQDYFAFVWGRLRDITAAPNGDIYIATNTAPFRIIKMRATGPVPVEVTDFSYSCLANNSIYLKWRSNREQNNAGFVLEKSADGVNFRRIALLPSQTENGNSSVPLSYNFIDEEGGQDLAYYRLSSEDLDGRSRFYPILTAECTRYSSVRLVPNPANNVAVLQTGRNELVRIKVYDGLGRQVYQVVSQGNVSLPVAKWQPGIYTVIAAAENGKVIYRGKLAVSGY